MAKMTLAQKLYQRKIRRPPAVIYPLLANIWRMIFVKKLGVTFEYKVNPKDYKGPFIVVSNHASRLDYIYTGLPFLPHRMNYVAGYNEFFRSHLAFVFRLLQIIPKKNFTADIYCIKEITRIIKAGGIVCIFPEGMSSISGANQPVALGSAKLLKHFGVPVLMCHIEGGYLTNTKYCLDERRGKVKVTVDQLFTSEQLSALSEDEITDMLHDALKQDDYAWNKKARVAYDGHGDMAKNLHDLLYMCPKCREELTMKGEGNRIFCTSCGNGATLNEYYDLIPFDDGCVIPGSPREWFDWERKIASREVSFPGFELKSRVKMGMLPQYKLLKNQATSEIVGEGVLSLDSTGLTYKGTRRGQEVELHMDTLNLPTYGMCTDVSRFYTFFDGEFTEFYPEEGSVGKWLHCTEEMHRFMGGKWQNFKDAATRYDS